LVLDYPVTSADARGDNWVWLVLYTFVQASPRSCDELVGHLAGHYDVQNKTPVALYTSGNLVGAVIGGLGVHCAADWGR
jgi:hypothetical protein